MFPLDRSSHPPRSTREPITISGSRRRTKASSIPLHRAGGRKRKLRDYIVLLGGRSDHPPASPKSLSLLSGNLWWGNYTGAQPPINTVARPLNR